MRWQSPKEIGKIRLLLLAGLLALLLLSCRQGEPEGEKKALPRGEAFLQIGLIPEHSLFAQKELYAPLMEYLAGRIGIGIELKVLSRYGNIINNFRSSGLDGAFFGSFTGALALSRLGVVPIARPEYPGGVSTYYGMIFVRKDSGIATVEDMKEKRFAFVDKATTAGWLLPLYYFSTHGVTDPAAWLAESYFTGTHEDAIHDVLNGKADIGAAKNTVFNRLAAQEPRILEELEILATSPTVPANGLLVRSDLEPALVEKIRKELLGMDREPEGREVLAGLGAVRFVATGVEDYLPVFDYAKAVGLDLKHYDYMNN